MAAVALNQPTNLTAIPVPWLCLAQSGTQATADRFAYMPFIGLYIVAVWGAASLFQHLPRPRAMAAAAFIPICLILAGLTWQHTQHWRDSITLFSRVLEVNPDNYRMRDLLAKNLSQKGDLDAAEAQFRLVLQDQPDYAESLEGMGVVYVIRGEHEKALEVLHRSLNINPISWEAINAKGGALFGLGRLEEAGKAFSQALEHNPESEMVRTNLATVERLPAIQDGNGNTE